MLKLEPIEFFLRAIPEGFMLILAIYAFSKVRLDKKRYIISAVITAISVIIVRKLPITYGVHTILAMAITIMLSVIINKIDVAKAIRSMLVVVIIQFTLEGVNIFIIQNILKGDMDLIFSDPVLKTLYGLPSIFMLFIVVSNYYIYVKKKGGLVSV